MISLDSIKPIQGRVGYGSLGLRGSLGYEDRAVTVGGVHYSRALSSHPPARLLYHLGGKASSFQCHVALNDDVKAGASYADFTVLADGREVAGVTGVWAGDEPRELACDLTGAELLELVVSTDKWEFCHAVWLDPAIDQASDPTLGGKITDPLERAEIELPPPIGPVGRCVATVASPGWEQLLDDMLGSVVANGGCPDALLVVFLLESSAECERVVAKYRALPVRCHPLASPGKGSKSVLYSVASVVEAERYVCLDSDMLVLDTLEPLFHAIDASPQTSVFACREANGHRHRDMLDALDRVYWGKPGDLAQIIGGDPGDAGSYPLIVNDGAFAGSRRALLGLDAAMRAMPGAADWTDSRPDAPWRNQFIFNLALAVRGCGVELDERYNVQLNYTDVAIGSVSGRPQVTWQGEDVRILHASGGGRDKCLQLRGLYSSVPDPMVGRGQGDAYGIFLSVLRAWLGRYGLSGLRFSPPEGREPGDVGARDPSVVPVLALLHYLIRANDCTAVLESSTARGISAACLASAVSHRPGARVVTFDPHEMAGRDELWAALPAVMGGCIEQREEDSLKGLRRAVRRGERYDAALLDSSCAPARLSAQLELASNLVGPDGLILTHDFAVTGNGNRVALAAEKSGHAVVSLLANGAGTRVGLVEKRSRSCG